MKKCYIFGAMPCPKEINKPSSSDMVIAADGGYSYCIKSGIIPDLTVGDFDSLENIKPEGKVITHSPIKNDTDMKLAADEGLKAGCDSFIIYGGTGGRTDHFIANLSLIVYLSRKNKKAVLCSEKETFMALTDGNLELSEKRKGYVSVFSADSQVSGVNLRNLKYRLDDATLTNDYALGVSNEFLGKKSKISVASGTVIISLEGNYIEDLLLY